MRCPNCTMQNEAGRKFCIECGTRLSGGCPLCGNENPPDAKFCGECGTPLGGGPSVASAVGEEPRAAPVAERRLVSVLFADLVGFTGLAEDQDPEAVRELLSRYFAVTRDVIARYGGVVEKFIGDAVMAVWGAPTAYEDDAERAVRAALELVVTVPTVDPSMTLRASVMTGDAAVTVGASGEGMVAGDLVNTASRLQSVAPPGAVLVGDATHSQTREAIAYEPVEAQQLRGKSLHVATWRALRVIAGRGGSGRSEQLEPPFVGREAELRQLKEALHAVGGDKRPRLVSIVGQPGIGKSRLVWELEKYIDGIVETVYWHHGRSPAYGEGITFWALGEMVRQRARIAETDDAPTSRARLREAVAEYVPDDVERAWIEPRLAALLGLADAPEGDRLELFAAWRRFFERIAERGTTVLVFEDLQWADSGVAAFIESLIEWSRSSPILVVTLARPELLDRHPSWGAGQHNFTSLHIDPLPDSDMRGLLAGLVPGLPEQAVKRIVEHAEGIPLYAVETVRTLLDAGRVMRDEESGAYRLAGELGELKASGSLHALIAARLDALDPHDRQLVQDASVLGQTFAVAALAALADRPAAQLEERLRGLVRREVLIYDTDPRSVERGQFHFIQSLVREVAHQTLSRATRRAKHLAAARYFEALGDDELAAVLASHYFEAYQATPVGEEADALAAQARLAVRGAAERAIALHSYDQAISLYEQGLSLTRDAEEQAVLLDRAAAAAEMALRIDDAERFLQQAIELHQQRGDRPAAARASARLGGVWLTDGRVDEAIIQLQDSLREMEEVGGDDRTLAQLEAGLGRAFMLRGEGVELEHLDRALELAAKVDDIPTIIEALTSKGPALEHAGRRREGVAVLAGAVKLAELHGQSRLLFRVMYNLAGRLYADDPQETRNVLRRAVEHGRRLGDRQWLTLAGSFLATTEIDLGEWDRAEQLISEFLQQPISDLTRARMTVDLAALAAARGDFVKADDLLETADRLAVGFSKVDDLLLIRLGRAEVAETAGRYGEACDRKLEVAQSPGALGFTFFAALSAVGAAVLARDSDRLARARAVAESVAGRERGRMPDALWLRTNACYAAVEGRLDEAAAGFRDSAAILRATGHMMGLIQCQMVCVGALGADHPLAREAADEARQICARVGATGLLARLEELAGAGGVARRAAATER